MTGVLGSIQDRTHHHGTGRYVIPVAVLSVLTGILSTRTPPANAVPVVPNFTQGSMTSHTETTSKITETINSMDYNTGYQYSATGTGVTAMGTCPQVQEQTM